MKSIIPIILALAAASANAGCRWTQHHDSLQFKGDKRAHFIWSVAGAAGVVAANHTLDLGMSPAQEAAVAIVPGLIREIKAGCDRDGHGGFSHQDMLYNALGVLAGVAVGEGVRVMLTPRSVHVALEF